MIHILRRRLPLLGALLILPGFLLLSLLSIGRTLPPWVPEPVQTLVFDTRLAVGPLARKVISLTNSSPQELNFYLDEAEETIHFESDGLRLAGTLYRPRADRPAPGIILVHGSTPEGRQLGLYRLLGRELAERGYVVLAIDQRGFGESEDPPRTDHVEALVGTEDVRSAVIYLVKNEEVDNSRLYVIGHSLGADSAIVAGMADPYLQKIVAVGPPRRVSGRLGEANGSELAYFRRRLYRYMALEEPIPAEVVLQASEVNNLATHIGYFGRAGHKPLFVLDGALESEEDRRFQEELCQQIVDPSKCLTLPNADHYANVANFGSLIVFDQAVADRLVAEIDQWLSED